MEDGRPSITAFVVAALRAHHRLTTPPPRILDDELAMPLAGMATAADVAARVDGFVARMAAYGDRDAAAATVRRIMMVTCARSRFMQEQLAASRARGISQLVILGAGLDSTAYRCGAIAEGLAVFEIDHPATQAWKRARLGAIGAQVPDNLSFTPFDFDRQTLAEALAAGGVRADRMTFFAWLGVQPYLADETVMATLDVVAGFPPGSELVLDLATPGRLRRGTDMERGGREIVAAFGEPYRSAYPPEVFETRLSERGFTRIEMVSVHDWLAANADRFNGVFPADARTSMLVSAQTG